MGFHVYPNFDRVDGWEDKREIMSKYATKTDDELKDVVSWGSLEFGAAARAELARRERMEADVSAEKG